MYHRVQAYRSNPRAFLHEWVDLTEAAREEVSLARELLPEVSLTDEALALGMGLIERLVIDSHRAEYAMFEAARAYAAADGRIKAGPHDVAFVAPLALRQRRSQFMNDFFSAIQAEDQQITAYMDEAAVK